MNILIDTVVQCNFSRHWGSMISNYQEPSELVSIPAESVKWVFQHAPVIQATWGTSKADTKFKARLGNERAEGNYLRALKGPG